MKIAILGTGMVGKTIAKDLNNKEYELVMGTRDPFKSELVEWRNSNVPGLELATFTQAASDADFLMLAVNWQVIDSVLDLVSQGEVKGKTLLDLTNPLDFSSGEPQLAIGFNDSAGETVQRGLSDVNVVKALNTVTASLMIDPQFEDGIPDMVIAGNSDEAKKQATQFLEEVGWRVVDAGDITKSRLIEPLAMIWINHSIKSGSSRHGFSMLRK